MKRAVNFLAVINIIFLLMLTLSGAVGAPLGTFIYYAAFILPTALSFALCRADAKKISLKKLLPNKNSLPVILTAAAPFIALVMLVSLLSSALLGALDFERPTTDVSGNIFTVVLRHAVLPALLEELLFRFVPTEMLSRYSKKAALLFSALLFSLIHCDLFQLPYAFTAGMILSYITLISGSVFPAFILHFINNLISVILMRNNDSPLITNGIYISLAAASVLSCIYILIRRKKHIGEMKALFSGGESPVFTLAAAAFAAISIGLAVLKLAAIA